LGFWGPFRLGFGPLGIVSPRAEATPALGTAEAEDVSLREFRVEGLQVDATRGTSGLARSGSSNHLGLAPSTPVGHIFLTFVSRTH
jgi:hypothetical protein